VDAGDKPSGLVLARRILEGGVPLDRLPGFVGLSGEDLDGRIVDAGDEASGLVLARRVLEGGVPLDRLGRRAGHRRATGHLQQKQK